MSEFKIGPQSRRDFFKKVGGSAAALAALGVMGMLGLTAYAGVYVQCQPKAGETVVVCFAPADGREHEELWVFGEVARVTTQRRADDDTPGVGMGIEFVDLSAAEKTRIEVWLHTQRAPVPRRRRPVRAPRPAPPALPVCWR